MCVKEGKGQLIDWKYASELNFEKHDFIDCEFVYLIKLETTIMEKFYEDIK